MKYDLVIPKFRPTPLNRLLYARVSQRIRLKKADRQMIGCYFALAKLPRAAGRRRVTLRVRLKPRMQELDVDSLQKSTLDSLVHCGALRGDRAADVEWGGVTCERGTAEDWGTTLMIEDMEEFNG